MICLDIGPGAWQSWLKKLLTFQITALSQATHFLSFNQQHIAIPTGNNKTAQRIPEKKRIIFLDCSKMSLIDKNQTLSKNLY